MSNSLADVRAWATQELRHITDVPELESALLLAHSLHVSNTHLLAWPEKKISDADQEHFVELVKRRQTGEPIAYITGYKEFWSLDITVTPAVLIPRPETELLVECVLERMPQTLAIVADLGTGSGAISLALNRERPHWEIHATDISEMALAVAQQNKNKLGAKQICFHRGSWCEPLSGLAFDAIVTNPPYIAAEDPELSGSVLQFEPKSALISPEDGLKDIRDIVYQSRQSLKPGGIIFIEHGSRQAKKVASILAEAGYTVMDIVKDLAGLDRVTIASWQGYDVN